MEQGYGDEPPTDDRHRVGHLGGAALDNQVNDEQKAEKSSDDQQSRNDLAPCWYVSRAEIRNEFLMLIQLLSPFFPHSNWNGNVRAP